MIQMISYLEFCFCKYYFGHTTFLYLSRRSSKDRQCLFFLISGFLVESLQVKKTSKKDHTFYNKNSLKNPHPFYEPRLAYYSWKPFWLHKFSSKLVCLVLEKIFAFLKHSERKSLYISTYLLKKSFFPLT